MLLKVARNLFVHIPDIINRFLIFFEFIHFLANARILVHVALAEFHNELFPPALESLNQLAKPGLNILLLLKVHALYVVE